MLIWATDATVGAPVVGVTMTPDGDTGLEPAASVGGTGASIVVDGPGPAADTVVSTSARNVARPAERVGSVPSSPRPCARSTSATASTAAKATRRRMAGRSYGAVRVRDPNSG